MIRIKITFAKDIRQIADLSATNDVRRYGFWRAVANHIGRITDVLAIKLKLPRVRDIITRGKWSHDKRNHSADKWTQDGRN